MKNYGLLLLCAISVFAQQPNTLRGFAYNPYGTLGAAPTIGDILQKPSDIYGHKFVYVSPASGSGYSAFDLVGGSALLGFDQSQDTKIKEASIGITGGNMLVWDLKLAFSLANAKANSYGEGGFGETDWIQATPTFNFDLVYKILQNERLFTAGLNNTFYWQYNIKRSSQRK